jgi:hypothetical protein
MSTPSQHEPPLADDVIPTDELIHRHGVNRSGPSMTSPPASVRLPMRVRSVPGRPLQLAARDRVSLVVLDTDAASALLRRRVPACLTTTLLAGQVLAITFVTVGRMTKWDPCPTLKTRPAVTRCSGSSTASSPSRRTARSQPPRSELATPSARTRRELDGSLRRVR